MSEAVVLYAGLSYMFTVDNTIELGVIAFGLLWLSSDFAIWVYRYVIQPSAKAIAKG
jgi:hypothetical protein